MSDFLKLYKNYSNSLRGLFYIPLRYLIMPMEQISFNLPKKGTVLDIGCGDGLVALYIAQKGKGRKVVGVDTNAKRLKNAKIAAKNVRNLSYERKSALSLGSKIDGAVMSDFLHHIPKEQHSKLLKSVYNNLSTGGKLVIKEIDTGDAIRSGISRLFDCMFYPKDEIYFRNAFELKKELTTIGFTVEIDKVKKFFPGSTTLFTCVKK